MPIVLHRIDDRLIHGQVVVGWGQPLCAGFIVLVDDNVAESEWEQELYRMGVPPRVRVIFASVQGAAEQYALFAADPSPGILLTGDIESMRRLAAATPVIKTVNVGGIHHRADRTQKLRYVFLNANEETSLRALSALGATVTAQDVPSSRPVSLDDILRGEL
jgi:PTS system mannose-specific IIB component/fructoselysine and glucoselysine-specific PTS system IIB component